jgi:hypothetical protein
MAKLYIFCNVPLYGIDNYEQCGLIFRNITEHLEYVISKNKNYEPVILANTSWEHHSPESLKFTNHFFKIYSSKKSIDYHLVYNKSVNQTLDYPLDNGLTYKFFLNKIFQSKLVGLQKFNKSWKNKKFKFLFLCNKLDKSNRILPLINFEKYNLLNEKNCIWSLHDQSFCFENIFSVIEDHSINFTRSELELFLTKYQKNPDQISPLIRNNTIHYDGIPFDHSLYKASSLSVVSESQTHPLYIWITEKTWRAIVNKHPFIIAGQPRTLEYLKRYGFKTFENYLPYEYDSIVDFEERFENIYKNLIWLKNHWEDLDFEKITEDVNYNFELARSIHQKDIDNFVKNVNYKKGDKIVHAGLYFNDQDAVKEIDLEQDHLFYYNYANLETTHFWKNK